MLNHLKGKHIGKFFIDSIGESGNSAGSSGMFPGLPGSVTTGNYFSGISDAKVPHMVQTGLTITGAFAKQLSRYRHNYASYARGGEKCKELDRLLAIFIVKYLKEQ